MPPVLGATSWLRFHTELLHFRDGHLAGSGFSGIHWWPHTSHSQTSRWINAIWLMYHYRMSKWNHSMCILCWRLRRGNREPFRLKDPKETICCFCGEKHQSGIFVRADPESTICKGEHDD